ncbi:STAS domain-containing protein [Streptomyces sp. IBSBF 2806]|uniref:STAS domain-containing protein n=1 Tax=Streptomyces sp. IBSBF 2806 TaxID=2903529 RepID=UPI002FDC7737
MTDHPHSGRSDQLRAQRTLVDGIRVVSIIGEIDDDVHAAFSQALMSEDGAIAPLRIVADLSNVTFIDSTGINVLVAAHQRVSDAQGWLRLAGAQEPVARVLRLVGLDTLIDFHPSVEQALNA